MKSLTMIALTTALLGSVTAMAADTKASKADQKFLTDAIQGNLAEVQMGQLAQQNGQSADVKSYGQMLVTDHTASNDQAKKVADQMGVTAPTEPSAKQKAMHDKMAKMTGADFDKAFAKDMVADHKKDIAMFQKEAKKKNDPAADFASNTLPTLQKHLDAAQKLNRGGSASR
jgi:putative membrane protein